MKRKSVVRVFALVVIVAVLALLAAFPAAIVFVNLSRPSLGRIFLANQESSVSLAVRNETASFAFAADVDARKSSALVPSLAALFEVYSEEMEEVVALDDVGAEKMRPSVDETLPLTRDSAFDDALRSALESAWNDGIVRAELALELPLRVWEVPLAAFLLARFKTTHQEAGNQTAQPREFNTSALKALILRQLQGTSPSASILAENLLDATVLDLENVQSSAHLGIVRLDVALIEALADTFCPEVPTPFGACRAFDLRREVIRSVLSRWLESLEDSFQVQLHFRWQLKGTMLFVANTAEGLQRIVEARQPPPGMVASLPVTADLPAGRVALLVRQAHLQNNLLALLSGVERHSAELEGAQSGLSEHLTSPAGEESIAFVEEGVSFLTRWSSEVLLEAHRSGQGWNARLWYENPDVVRDVEGSDALVNESAAEHFKKFVAPWLGAAHEHRVRWAAEDRVVIDARLSGVSASPSRDLSQSVNSNSL